MVQSRARYLIGLCVLAALAVGCAPGTAQPGPDGFEGRLVTAINTDRARVALTPLTWNSQLGANACAHARQMAATHVYAHQDLQALSETAPYAVFDRLAENLYTNASVQTAEAVEATFMGSGEHRSNILGPFRWIGVCSATSTDGAFWVAVELGG